MENEGNNENGTQQVNQGEPHGEPHDTDWKAEARKWERLAKANKAKADQWDAQEEANKTELEKAQARAKKLEDELNGVKAAQARAAEVAKAAKENGVSADLLSRMEGDVAENAAFLKSYGGSEHRYPQTRDNGEAGKNSNQADVMREVARQLFGRKS